MIHNSNGRTLIRLACVVGLAVSACATEVADEGSTDATAPTSVVDPETGELVAMNYERPSSEPIYADALLDAKNLSTGFQEVVSGSNETDAMVNLQQNGVIVGIGARVDNDDITTLVVHGRVNQSDGQLGPVLEFRGGTQPNHGLEVFCAAPPGNAIVGVGGRISSGHAFTTMHIWSRPYNPATRELSGQAFEQRCGSVPDSTLENRLVAWEHVPDSDLNFTVFNGIGMRDQNNAVAGIKVRVRTVCQSSAQCQ
jgi:hypothetical protein